MLTHRRPIPAGRTRFVSLVWVSIGLLLAAGCAPRPAEPPSRPAGPEQPGIAIPAGATVFDVDAARSVVTIRTNARPKASESPRSAGVERRSPSARLSAAWRQDREDGMAPF